MLIVSLHNYNTEKQKRKRTHCREDLQMRGSELFRWSGGRLMSENVCGCNCESSRAAMFADLAPTLEKYAKVPGSLITILQKAQEIYGYLSPDAINYISECTGIAPAKIYGVATFYGNFSLDAKGKYVMKVCRGTACHVRKSGNVLQALYDATGTDEQKATSDDGLFTLEIVSCLGACGLSPVVMVNDTVHAAMTPEKARALVAELREEA